MKYISFILGIVWSIFPSVYIYADDIKKPHIIPRINWEANEQFTSLESPFWVSILEARRNFTPRPIDPSLAELRKQNNQRAIAYINENFSPENKIIETVLYDEIDWFRLAWPLKYTEYVHAIIVHHTTWTYDSDIDALKDIYKFHSLQRWWGDIGYHYIIGLEGKIYEWKKWGDYVVWAHSKWNNNSTVGISVIGDYSVKWVNLQQYEALASLVQYLSWQYGIDTWKDYYYHMDCYKEYCDTFPLITRREGRLVGHRDTWNTTCPWDALYSQLMFLKKDIDNFSKWFISVKRWEVPTGEREKKHSLQTSYDSVVLKILQDKTYEELVTIQSRLKTINSTHLSKKSQDILLSLKKITHILLDTKKS